MAAIGARIARGAFEGGLDALAIASALALAALTGLTWNRGRIVYRLRRGPGSEVAVETETFWACSPSRPWRSRSWRLVVTIVG